MIADYALSTGAATARTQHEKDFHEQPARTYSAPKRSSASPKQRSGRSASTEALRPAQGQAKTRPLPSPKEGEQDFRVRYDDWDLEHAAAVSLKDGTALPAPQHRPTSSAVLGE